MNVTTKLTITLLLATSITALTTDFTWDDRGYLMYCPCQGQFANQIDYLIGALYFARALDRTLVVPPFITYNWANEEYPINLHEADQYFDLEKLSKFHRIIRSADFMETFQTSPIWSAKTVHCYYGAIDIDERCPTHKGAPFKFFWRGIGIDDFQYSQRIDRKLPMIATYSDDWHQKYPPELVPVLAIHGAVSRYPVEEPALLAVQRHLDFCQLVKEKTEAVIFNKLSRPFLAVHLRGDAEWTRACQGIELLHKETSSTPQCTGHSDGFGVWPRHPPFRTMTMRKCHPGIGKVKEKIASLLNKNQKVKHIYIATDNQVRRDPWFIDQIRAHIENTHHVQHVEQYRSQVHLVYHEFDDPILDISIMAEADVWVGNCVSSISAVVKRTRDAWKKRSVFFGYKWADGQLDNDRFEL